MPHPRRRDVVMPVYLRKLVHMAGAAFVFIALFDGYVAIGLSLLGIAAFIALEAVKPGLDKKLLLTLYRERELGSCAYEPMYFLIAILGLLIISLVFMPAACYGAIVVLTIGDGAATMVGRALGKLKMPFSEKTVAGSLSGFALAAIIGYFVAGPAIIVGAAAGMVVEAYTNKYENLLVAIAAFLSMALVLYLAAL